MAKTRFQARKRVKNSHIVFRGSYRKNEVEGPPYMKTYVKISSICNQLIYSLYLKYCRFTFKSSFQNTYFCIETYGSVN